MKVRDVMSHHVQRISSSAMVSEAAEKMRIFNIGILPILEDNKIVGMLTDRDIVIRVVAAGLNPKITVIKDVYTPDAICCHEDEDIETVASIMEDNQVRRLLVLDHDDNVAGILSIGDLALKTNIDHLTDEILEKVCEPARVE
jgi:CBS domain-containing protein